METRAQLAEKGDLEIVPIIKEFVDAFLEEILGLSPSRDIEFTIHLVP